MEPHPRTSKRKLLHIIITLQNGWQRGDKFTMTEHKWENSSPHPEKLFADMPANHSFAGLHTILGSSNDRAPSLNVLSSDPAIELKSIHFVNVR